MNLTQGLFDLVAVALVAALTPIVVALLPGPRVPQVVVFLIGGILIGPHVLGLANVASIQLLANIGLGFLFLLAGYELEPHLLREEPGRLAMIGGVSATSMDLPPFLINQYINVVAGVNVIGMRRAGVCNASIDAVRKAFHLIYRSDSLLKHSLAEVERQLGHVAEVAEFVAFIRASKRGVSLDRDRTRMAA